MPQLLQVHPSTSVVNRCSSPGPRCNGHRNGLCCAGRHVCGASCGFPCSVDSYCCAAATLAVTGALPLAMAGGALLHSSGATSFETLSTGTGTSGAVVCCQDVRAQSCAYLQLAPNLQPAAVVTSLQGIVFVSIGWSSPYQHSSCDDFVVHQTAHSIWYI